MKTLRSQPKAAKKSAVKKLKPVIQVRVYFGADNQASYELDPSMFPTVSDVRLNIKSRHKNVTKAEVQFPDEEPEVLTFKRKTKTPAAK